MIAVIALLLMLLAGCDGDAIISNAAPAQDTIEVEDSANAVMVSSNAASVRIDKGNAGLHLTDAAGVLLTEFAGAPTLMLDDTAHPLQAVHSVRRLDRGVELTCGAGDATVLWTVEFLTARTVVSRLRPSNASAVTRVATALHVTADEHFYGLTERIVDAPSASIADRLASEVAPGAVGALDRRGQSITMAITPTMGLYTPFFHSSRGYGAYVEGTMTGRFDVAKTDPNAVVMDFEFNRRTAEHGIVFFVGNYDTILDEYTALTGRPFTPPRWALRHLRWRDEHRMGPPAQLDGTDMNADFVDDITMYDAFGIPAGTYEFDRPWTSGTTDRGQSGFTSFEFDPQRFPNSAAMLQALQQRGYHIAVFGAPWALGENAVDAEHFGYYAPRNDILIDFTNPDAVAWWTGRVQTLIDKGITGMKLDRGELQSTVTELVNVPDQATDIWADGRNGRELKNDYVVQFAKVHYDAFSTRLGGDFFHYLRAGYAGSQRYGIFWGGDTPGTTNFGLGQATDLGLRSAIQSLAHVAFMGFPIWGTDTGGYYQFGDREVFARWLEFSALCPFMEIGGGGTHAPWNMPTQPAYDTEMIDIYRRAVALHHELIPLLYSLSFDARRSGRPLVRPLVFDFPADPAVADLWDEFILGQALLAAPVWQAGARSRQVYLPVGTWIDFWNPTARFDGPATIVADAPLDHIPLYVRAGGILPLDVNSAANENGSVASAGRLTIDGYPAGMSTLTLHEDGGDSTFRLSTAQCGGTACVQLQIDADPRSYVVRLLTTGPSRVTVNDLPVRREDSFAAMEMTDPAWFYDTTAGRLWIRFSAESSLVRVEAIE